MFSKRKDSSRFSDGANYGFNGTNATEIQSLVTSQSSAIRVIARRGEQAGIDNIDGIIRVAENVIAAPGDIGVQLSTEDIGNGVTRSAGCVGQEKPVPLPMCDSLTPVTKS